ncbi:AMP-binding protein [Streptomyces sp. NPDC097617]|uniref:AMP-binding protein n=1 Tax=Streptomyces sp. NPDC097617 TaxID=3366091 RepID=UPI00380EA7A8
MTTRQELPAARTAAAGADEAADLGTLLVRAAARFPEHGLRYCSGERPPGHTLCTCPRLLDESLRLLAALRDAGARPGRVVALMLERPEDFLPALWACLLGGITACPLVPLRNDPQRWAAQLRHVDALLERPLLITDRRTREELPAGPGPAVVIVEDLVRAAAGTDASTVVTSTCASDEVALLVLTSGSTGAAKAVRLTHGNLLASMAAKAGAQSLTADDVTLNWISYDHVAALLEAHLLPLSVGAVQLQASPESVLADPRHFLELIDAHRVTMTFTPNFLLGLIGKALDGDHQRQRARLRLPGAVRRRLVPGDRLGRRGRPARRRSG